MRKKPFVLEPPDFCITGRRLAWMLPRALKDDFMAEDEAAFAIEAPIYAPTGSVRSIDLGDEIYGTTSELRT